MGIKFLCSTCQRKLNVKSFLAGKRGVCPHCNAKVDIPYESQLPNGKSKGDSLGPSPQLPLRAAPAIAAAVHSETQSPAAHLAGAATASIGGPAIPTSAMGAPASPRESSAPVTDPIIEAPDAVWYVRPPSGGQFGPARGEIMRKWLSEGRVSADSLVWREGWADWKLAAPLFPSLSSDGPRFAAASGDIPAAVAASPSGAPVHYRSRRRRSNSLAAVFTIMLIILAIVAVGVLVWVVQH